MTFPQSGVRGRLVLSSLFSLILLSVLLGGCGGAQARKTKHLERGETYLKDENYDKARIEFRNALQIDPNNAQARFRSGEIAEKTGNIREAAGFYQGAIDVDPNHVKASANLGKLYVFGGAPDRALKLVEPLLAKGEDADLLTVRGAARLRSDDQAGALADASRAVALAGNNENAIALLAAVYRRGDRDKDAVVLLQDALKRIPNSTDLRQVLAQLYLQLNDPASAERELQQLVKLNPKVQAYRQQLALYYLRSKQTGKAETVLREAVAADAKSLEPKLALTEFLATQRSREQAEAQFTKFIAAEPKNYDLRFGLARLYENSAQLPKAEAIYRDVIKLDSRGPQGLSARNRLAAQKVMMGQLDEAASLASEVLQENPRDADALILRGNIALARKQPQSAIADLRAVLRDQPNSVGVLRTLARAHLENNEPALAEENLKAAVTANPLDVPARIDLAQLLMRNEQSQGALELLEKAVRDAPNDVSAREALFKVQVALKQWPAAQRTAEDIKLMLPGRALGYYLSGLVKQSQDHVPEALQEYQEALKRQPDAAEPLTAVVRIHLAAKKADAAVAQLKKVMAEFPKNAVAANLLGEVLLAQKQPAEALKALALATERAPAWWLPYRNTALAYFAQGQQDQAIQTYESGIQASGTSPVLISDLAAIHERNGKYEDAIRQYETLLKQQPDSDMGANNLAMLLVSYRKDQKSLDRARDLVVRFASSTNAAYLDTHGWVKYKRGEVAEALPVFERAVQQMPESAVMRYHLAMAQFHAGQHQQARVNLERVLQKGANFAGADQARSTLEELKKQQG